MFALLMGMLNLSEGFIGPQLGNFFNRFVGVTQENLTDLWKLILIETCCELVPLLFIYLIPSRAEVEAV